MSTFNFKSLCSTLFLYLGGGNWILTTYCSINNRLHREPSLKQSMAQKITEIFFLYHFRLLCKETLDICGAKTEFLKLITVFFCLSEKHIFSSCSWRLPFVLSVGQNRWQEVADVDCQIPWCLKHKASKYKVSKYKSKYKIQDKGEAYIQKANKFKDFAFQQKSA